MFSVYIQYTTLDKSLCLEFVAPEYAWGGVEGPGQSECSGESFASDLKKEKKERIIRHIT